jgi:membrane-bound lytic murein transglycosylase B
MWAAKTGGQMNARAAKALGWKWLAGLCLAAALLTALPAGQANADSGRQQAEAQFAAWREALWGEVQAAGVSRATFDGALGNLTLDWSLPDLEPPGAAALSASRRSRRSSAARGAISPNPTFRSW